MHIEVYRSVYNFLGDIENINSPETDFLSKSRLTRVLALERNATLVEDAGLLTALVFYVLKHPRVAYRTIRELKKDD